MEKHLGMVVAVEMAAVERKYGEPKSREISCGYEISLYDVGGASLYVCRCGEGEVAAAGATMLLLAKYGVSLILNFGIVGGLTPAMGQYELAVVDKVVHYGFDTSPVDPVKKGQLPGEGSPYLCFDRGLIEIAKAAIPGLREVTCCSGDRFIGSPEEKQALHEEWGADICEMEAAGILLIAKRAGVPALSIKMVSDAISGGPEQFYQAKERCSEACLNAVDEIIKTL